MKQHHDTGHMSIRFSLVVLAAIGSATTGKSVDFGAVQRGGAAAVQKESRVPVIDTTSSMSAALANGDLQVLTDAIVRPVDKAATVPMPRCLDVETPSRCVIACVTLPSGSRVSNIEGFVLDEARVWRPCDGKACLGKTALSPTGALFEPTGPEQRATEKGPRVCWGFRNWSDSLKRIRLLVSFKPVLVNLTAQIGQ